ncbi:zinc-dependent metalloprotease [Corallococcus llansteffanensis]|uniref:Protease n=1 Tax=Corallococcus llansteffanensis TaxID=2316731 RepID=A0A3A8PF46_9BACT|nr:zinc-dependent metalloprotease [Corallococcus llansteffanensis]RKH52195.1 protease [Corallococcus llansteffanensis]
MFKRAAVVVVSCGAVLAGCGTDPRIENEEIVSNLVEAGFPAADIRVVEEAVYVGNDAHVSLTASREMLQPGEGSAEQYRTTNLVSTAAVTRICLNPTSTFNSYSRLSQGLDLAIANYNALGLCFSMVRGPTTGCSANITATTIPGNSGSSGFPSGGRPYGTISIGTGLQTATLDMAEWVITHELGHALGLRHSDFYSHAISCGTAGNEGTAGVGAILIPGTPSTATVNGSLMNSCPRPNETGEFTSTDIIALRALYQC